MKRFVAAGLLTAGVLAAQTVTFEADHVTSVGPLPTVAFTMTDFIGSRQVVKGLAYSSETTLESTQVLGDGNRIVTKNTSAFYRDSEGRTRREMTIETPGDSGEPHKIITIDDPVANVHYVLNTKDKTAAKIEMPPSGGPGGPGGAAGARIMAGPAVPAMPVPPPPPGAAGNVIFARRGMIAGRVLSSTTATVGNAAAPQVEQLGKQVMEGIEVVGTRTTHTIPAGQIGNEQPLISKSETWFSPELQTLILMKNSDPRFGEHTSRTTNVHRAEQPLYLFEVPQDYKIQEGRGPVIRTFDRKLDGPKEDDQD